MNSQSIPPHKVAFARLPQFQQSTHTDKQKQASLALGILFPKSPKKQEQEKK